MSDGLGIRDRALASAVAAYTAAYGHPLQAETTAERPGLHRWATPGRAVVAAVAALLLLGGVVVARAVRQAPSAVVALDGPQSGSGETAAVLDAGAPPTPSVVVHVVGQVQQPGVVTLPDGSRVADAIDAAGGAGAEADLSAVNLARVLVDGEQVIVPRPGEAIAPVGGSGPGSGVLNLNAADVGALDGLPGIGPVLAQRIVDWRADHGRFSAVEELTEVSGIGPTVLEGLRDLVTV
jgi:competence protein ComEA